MMTQDNILWFVHAVFIVGLVIAIVEACIIARGELL